jgi:hypothetical protein
MAELSRRAGAGPGALPLLGSGTLALLVLWAVGCDGCGDDSPAVPFKRVESVAPGSPEPAPSGPGAGTDSAAQEAAFVPRAGLSHPEGTLELGLGGGTVTVANGSLRASLELDLDADGTLDGLFVVSRPGAAPTLGFAMGGPSGPGLLQASSSTLEVEPGCGLRAARLLGISRHYVLASAELECTTPAAADAGVPPPPRVQAHQWIVAVEAAPRVLEHLWRNLDGAELAINVRSTDADADGHQDVQVTLSVGGSQTGERSSFDLIWLNRPSGLGRDPSEPETTLLERANQARVLLKKEPARAAAQARETLRLHGLLCRESGGAVLGVGNLLGLPCGASAAAGRATAVLATALANSGQVFETLRALEALSSPNYQVAAADAQRARDAAAQLPRLVGATWQPGPRLPGPAGSGVRRTRIAFLDEDHLLLRGEPALSYSLADSSSAVTSQHAESRVLSPDGRLAVGAVVRACDGYHLQVLDAAQLVQGLALGVSRAEPLLAAAAAPPQARCPGPLSRALREDAGGFQVLDWTERGVVVARDEERWLLALDAAGALQGAPKLLASNEAVAPLVPGPLSADGSRYARVSPVGVVRITLGASLKSDLLPPVPGDGALGEVVVSPSGRSVAVLRGTQVYVARVGDGAGTSTSTSTSTRTTTTTSTRTTTTTSTTTPTTTATTGGGPGAPPGGHRVDLPEPPAP